MLEVELKFQVPAAQAAGVAAALARGRLTAMRLHALVFDTADERLAARGIALRLRHEGTRWVQTMKAPGGGVHARIEHEVDRGRGARSRPPPLLPALHDAVPAGALLRAALGEIDAGSGLEHRFTIDVLRRQRVLRRGTARIELALDTGAIVLHDGRRLALHELEFELLAGPPQALFDAVLPWVERHGLWLDVVPKSQRGRLFAQGLLHAPAAAADPVAATAAMPLPALLRAALAACVPAVAGNAAELARGSDDAAHVHQLRVGIRRLRSLLRELAPAADPPWLAALTAAFRSLGPLRDQAALAVQFETALAAAGAPDARWPAAEGGAPLPAAVVCEPGFQRALLGLVAAADEPPAAGAGEAAARPLVAARLNKLHGRLVADGKRFESLPAQAQHRARKRLKRLRYLLEACAALFRADEVVGCLKRLRRAQDALGRLNDLQVAAERYRAAAAARPEAWFAAGWLQAQHAAQVRACGVALQRLRKAPRPWRRRCGGGLQRRRQVTKS